MGKIIWVTVSLIVIYLMPISMPDLASTNSAKKAQLEVVQIGDMTTDRAAHQATLLKSGKVLITGGCAGYSCEKILSSAELYDPASQTFQALPPMSTPRASHAAVTLPDGRVLIVGGWTGSQSTSSAEVYDPTTEQWKPVDEMSEARASLIAVALQDSSVLVMGGGNVDIFDPSSDSFLQVAESRTNHYLATLLADGRVLMTGGQGKNENILNAAAIFDPTTRKVQKTDVMKTPRVKHAALLLNDGHIMVIGGSDARGYKGRYSSTEIFDPETGRFSRGPAMQFGRHKIRDAVVKLHSGEILVAGGANKPEILDSTTEGFVPIKGQLSGPQMFATATLLSSGNVLILGGYDERIRTTDSAWLVRAVE